MCSIRDCLFCKSMVLVRHDNLTTRHPHHTTPSPHDTITTRHPHHTTPSPHDTITTRHPHHTTPSPHDTLTSLHHPPPVCVTTISYITLIIILVNKRLTWLHDGGIPHIIQYIRWVFLTETISRSHFFIHRCPSCGRRYVSPFEFVNLFIITCWLILISKSESNNQSKVVFTSRHSRSR